VSLYQGKPRQSLRLTGYNYGASGAYYVTCCTHQRQPLLVHPQLHVIVEKEWLALPQRFPAVTLDIFVIMPDHMHGLLWIDAEVKRAPTLFTIMKSYKSITAVAWTKHLRATGQEESGKIWQRSYHDEIIRNERHLAAVRQYILDNPSKEKAERRERRDRGCGWAWVGVLTDPVTC
jgi:putative transposase